VSCEGFHFREDLIRTNAPFQRRLGVAAHSKGAVRRAVHDSVENIDIIVPLVENHVPALRYSRCNKPHLALPVQKEGHHGEPRDGDFSGATGGDGGGEDGGEGVDGDRNIH